MSPATERPLKTHTELRLLFELDVFTELGDTQPHQAPPSSTHTHRPLTSLSGSSKHPLRKQQAELI